MLTLLLLSLLTSPQTLSVTVPANTPFDVSFKHDGLLMPSFRWWCDGAIAKNFSASETQQPAGTPDAAGLFTYTVTVPGLAAGSHTCFVSAFNDQGEVKAVPITFTVGGGPQPVGKPPAVPVDIRIVVRPGGV
jgi:hypothetical protein